MSARPRSRPPRRGASRARLILPVAGLGLIAASATLLVRRSGTPRATVSEVRQRIEDVALRAALPGAPRDAGAIGPWQVAAEAIDPQTGRLLRFRLDSGSMIIAAATARILVDPDADTFSFDLRDVVFTRVAAEDEGETGVHAIEHHVLGPAPYGMDIVADAPPHPPGGERPSPVVSAGD